MAQQFKPLEDSAVVTITPKYQFGLSHYTFKVYEFIAPAIVLFRNGIIRSLSSYPLDIGDKWFDDGLDCEILRPGAKGWQKGRVRIKVTLEFCPDEPEIQETPSNEQPKISEPESPDDLRQLINQNNP
ncbi:KGK domain-containing protein [Microseira wollei]|uniref:KGK family protein n=1 Tax=Microseira wollei NIES-4236 TaxID=2530354 RepID=A0AAV3XMA2_9CYAN|nr:KGK domain-containing protein [Microseira wollei]GET42165.1 hypothetical protein MiSe_69790 [Microseira wollei NIES-4236]